MLKALIIKKVMFYIFQHRNLSQIYCNKLLAEFIMIVVYATLELIKKYGHQHIILRFSRKCSNNVVL